MDLCYDAIGFNLSKKPARSEFVAKTKHKFEDCHVYQFTHELA